MGCHGKRVNPGPLVPDSPYSLVNPRDVGWVEKAIFAVRPTVWVPRRTFDAILSRP